MKIKTLKLNIETKGFTEIIDVTDRINKLIHESGISEGNALIFVPGATAGITTIEYEPGLLSDYPEVMEKIAPASGKYHHDETWHDGNGYAHIRSAIQGTSLTIPFLDKKLLLGTWQQIILVDYDNRPRNRNLIIQLTGI